MPINRLRAFLDEHDAKYVVISHSKAYTAQEVAASAHIPGKEVAKTVIVEIDGRLAMTVLPATAQVDFDQLQSVTGARQVDLVGEDDLKERFPDCEVGAMPPFGNLYDMEVFVADRLREDEEIAFNAGSHTRLIKMSYADYERLVKPTVLQFSTVEA